MRLDSSDFHRLVKRFTATEAETLIEADRAVIPRRRLEPGPAKTCAQETVQGLQQKRAAQTAPTMSRCHPQVLDASQTAALPQTLDAAAVARRRSHEPGCLRQKARLAADLVHERAATSAVSQAR